MFQGYVFFFILMFVTSTVQNMCWNICVGFEREKKSPWTWTRFINFFFVKDACSPRITNKIQIDTITFFRRRQHRFEWIFFVYFINVINKTHYILCIYFPCVLLCIYAELKYFTDFTLVSAARYIYANWFFFPCVWVVCAVFSLLISLKEFLLF